MMFLFRVWWCFDDDGYDQKIRVWWYFDDDVSDRKIKVLMLMLLIKRSKWWRYCWSKGQSAEDVADWKVKVLKMLMLIEESRCWRCCWSKRSKYWWCWRLNIEDEGYMMLKSFQWFIDVSTWWCWWCPLSLSYYCCCWCCYRILFSLRGVLKYCNFE